MIFCLRSLPALSLSHFISQSVLNEIVCNAIEPSLKQVNFFKTKTDIHDDEVLAKYYIIIEFSPFIIKQTHVNTSVFI